MTFHVQPNKMNLDKFLSLLKWCQDNGLVDSFSEITNETNEETEAFLMNMVKESREEYAKGNSLTNEEAEAKLDEWLKNQEDINWLKYKGILSNQSINEIDQQLNELRNSWE